MWNNVEPTRDSFAEYTPRYLQYQEARLTPKAYEPTQGIVNGHRLFSARRRSPEFVKFDIQRFLTERLTEVSVETARKEFSVLRHILRTAKDSDLIPANHADGVKLPNPSAGRVRYLQPAELRAVLEACPAWLRPIAVLLAFTGMRRSELLGLRWLDVDTQNGVVRLPQTKNGEGRTLWLNALASDVLGA